MVSTLLDPNCRKTTPEELVHRHRACHRDVEGLDRTDLGNGRRQIAMFENQAANARFATEDQRYWRWDVDRIQTRGAARRQGQTPIPTGRQFVEGAYEVDDPADRDVVHGPRRRFLDSRRDIGRAAFGDYRTAETRRYGGSQQSAQILRVVDLVEHQHGLTCRLEIGQNDIIKRQHLRDHPLVVLGAGILGKGRFVCGMNGDALATRQLGKLTVARRRAAGAPPRIPTSAEVDGTHTSRCDIQTALDGVDSEDSPTARRVYTARVIHYDFPR